MRPRSSPTTRSPASASSLHTIVPARPAPTTTASAALSLVTAIAASLSLPIQHDMLGITLRIHPHLVLLDVEDAHRLGAIRHIVLLHEFGIGGGGNPRKTDQLPTALVAIAAIHRVGKESFHRVSQQQAEKQLRGQRFELDLAVLQRVQHFILLRRGEKAERLAIVPAAMQIGLADRGAVD